MIQKQIDPSPRASLAPRRAWRQPRFGNIWSAALVAAGLLTASASAQSILFSDSMDSGDNWTINAASAQDTAEFGFDYSTIGIPPAPNGAGTTLGLMVRANRPIGAGALTGVSVSPNGQSFTGNYELVFDYWGGFPGPAPAGGAGSTQFTGAGIMTSGSVAHYAGAGDGLWFAATAEGGSSVDYRVYVRGSNQTTPALYPAAGQNHTAAYYQTSFAGGTTAPAAQTTLFPSQTGATAAGTVGWKWRLVKITKLGNNVTWDIDGIRMANVDLTTLTAAFGGDNILFGQGDINVGQTSAALDPMLFGLIDNVKVTQLANSILVSAVTDPDTGIDTVAEANTAAGALVKLYRPVETIADAVDVNIKLSGTATRGADASTGDYLIRTNGVVIPTSTVITIPAGSESALVEIVANNDAISELGETVVVEIAPGSYSPAPPLKATVNIMDNDPAVIDISTVVYNQMFEGNTYDFIRYRFERRGDLSLGPIDVNVAYAGTATAGSDFTPTLTVHFEPGDVGASNDVRVLNDATIEGPETVIASVAAGAGYTVGANNVLTAGATGAIVDDDLPAETILFADQLNDPAGLDHYILQYGSVTPESGDYTVQFGVDYNSAFAVPAAPNGSDTIGLVLSVNKLDTILEAAGLNLYPKDKTFSGDYALRVDMYLMQNGGASTTEYAMLGINHDTTHTNWFRNSGAGVPAGWTYDGIFAYIEADAGALGDYVLNSAPAAGLGGPTARASRSALALAQVFHSPPWTAGGGAGAPGNLPTSETPSWAQVELKQVANVVTLSINNSTIFSYTNTTAFTSGDIMLGYDDAYDSIGGGGGGLVIYDNLRVVSLTSGPINIVRVAQVGSNLEIDFDGVSGLPLSSFKLYGSATVGGAYTEVAGATYSTVSPTVYRAVVPISGTMNFFQIRK